MDNTEPLSYFNSFEIDISPQSESIGACDGRISQLRQRLMQFGKVMSNLEDLEKEMQHKQQIRAQHALSQQIMILNESIQNEKIKIKQLKQKATHFLDNECKQTFIPNTLELHKILSQKYVESQYDVIDKYKQEINDIKQGIKSNPSQILRLFYILFSIKDILSKIEHNTTDNAPNLMDGDNEFKNDVLSFETPHNKLQSTQSALIAYISDVLPSIKSKYLYELQKALKRVSWPKIGAHKVIDLSSPQKWADIELLCCDLFGIEFYIQYMTQNNIFTQITESVSESNTNASWVINKFLEPIIKRFEYNFNGNLKSNRLNKPEYFLNFTLQIIEDNLSLIKQVLQPLILENGLDLDIEMVFIYGLMDIVRLKCRKSIQIFAQLLNDTLAFKEKYSKRKELYERSAHVTRTAMKGMKVMSEISAQSLHSLYSSFKLFKEEKNENNNDVKYEQTAENKSDKELLKEKRKENEIKYKNTKYLIEHLINEMIEFQCKLNKMYAWTRNDLRGNIMNEILCIEIMETEWLEMEKERINKNSLLINTQNDIEIFNILHSDFITKYDNYYMTNATYDILTILQSIERRIGSIINIKYRYKFVKELVIQLLNLCMSYMEQEFPNHIHYRMGMNMDEINVCCGIINSTDYLCEFLRKWNGKISFQALSYYEQMNMNMNNNDPIPTVKWLTEQAKILKLNSNEFFNDFIQQNEYLQQKHFIGLSDVICHEFVLDCSQYLNETFGYIQYVENQQNETQNINESLSIQPEFEDGYYKLCDLLYACYKSLPFRLFEIVRNELSKNIDDKLFEKILNIKVTFFYSASNQLQYDLQHMFALFYVNELVLIPNYKPMNMNILFVDENIINKFPKLTSLLVIVTMDKIKLNEFIDALGINVHSNYNETEQIDIDQEMTSEKTKQILHRYSVDTLTVDKIRKIINKMSVVQSEKNNANQTSTQTNDHSDSDSQFSDF